jgi:hypothetical protein
MYLNMGLGGSTYTNEFRTYTNEFRISALSTSKVGPQIIHIRIFESFICSFETPCYPIRVDFPVFMSTRQARDALRTRAPMLIDRSGELSLPDLACNTRSLFPVPYPAQRLCNMRGSFFSPT